MSFPAFTTAARACAPSLSPAFGLRAARLKMNRPRGNRIDAHRVLSYGVVKKVHMGTTSTTRGGPRSKNPTNHMGKERRTWRTRTVRMGTWKGAPLGGASRRTRWICCLPLGDKSEAVRLFSRRGSKFKSMRLGDLTWSR